MAIYLCENCGFTKEISNEFINKKGKCPHCQQINVTKAKVEVEKAEAHHTKEDDDDLEQIANTNSRTNGNNENDSELNEYPLSSLPDAESEDLKNHEEEESEAAEDGEAERTKISQRLVRPTHYVPTKIQNRVSAPEGQQQFGKSNLLIDKNAEDGIDSNQDSSDENNEISSLPKSTTAAKKLRPGTAIFSTSAAMKLDDWIKQQLSGKNTELVKVLKDHFCDIHLTNNTFWVKSGSIVTLQGELKIQEQFTVPKNQRSNFLNRLIGNGVGLSRVSGNGQLLLADEGKTLINFYLKAQSITLNANYLLAFSDGFKFETNVLIPANTFLAPNIVKIDLQGTGHIILAIAGELHLHHLSEEKALKCHLQSIVGYEGDCDLKQKLEIDRSFYLGKTSGDKELVHFLGEGNVLLASERNDSLPTGKRAHRHFYYNHYFSLPKIFNLVLMALLFFWCLSNYWEFVQEKAKVRAVIEFEKMKINKKQAEEGKRKLSLDKVFEEKKKEIQDRFSPMIKSADDDPEAKKKIMRQYQEEIDELRREVYNTPI